MRGRANTVLPAQGERDQAIIKAVSAAREKAVHLSGQVEAQHSKIVLGVGQWHG